MRHWNFTSKEEIDDQGVLAYIHEAIVNQKLGKEIKPEKKSPTFSMPSLLQNALEGDANLQALFKGFSTYKQKEFAEYINEAKQEKTKRNRLNKILPMIEKGIGLNDAYRKP